MIASAACASLGSRVAADDDISSPANVLAYAQPFEAVPTAGLDHLAALRGGLRVGVLDVGFAANVRTLVNGTLVLESTTNLTPGGTTATQSNLPSIGAAPGTLSFVGANGVVLDSSSGVTTALHSVTREQILGVIFTTASNQQIRQEINVEVTIANFGRFQDAARDALFNGRLLGNVGLTN